MSASGWEHDERLLSDLRAALPGRGVDVYLDAALAAFRVGRTDGPADLAELVFDSACDPEPAGLTRASWSSRLLSFRSGQYTVDVEIGDDGLLGQVHPERPGAVPVGSVTGQTARGTFGTTALDDVGGFALPPPPPGPIRLRAHVADLTVVTDWLVLRYPTG